MKALRRSSCRGGLCDLTDRFVVCWSSEREERGGKKKAAAGGDMRKYMRKLKKKGKGKRGGREGVGVRCHDGREHELEIE